MPKKISTNPKAEAARERKADKKREEKERFEREKEDAKWEDNDKFNSRKQQRKDEKEQKRLASVQRKQESKAMLEQEESKHPGKSHQSSASAKVTRAQIADEKQKQAKIREKHEKHGNKDDQNEIFTEGNPNREWADLLATSGAVEARNVEDAIAVLGLEDSAVDLHPEKRMKAAYAAFEDERLPQLKAENPNLRMSQLKQLLRKEWLKSPENPMNKLSGGT